MKSNFITVMAAILDEGDIKGLPKTQLTSGQGGTVSKALQLVFAIAGAISLLIITIAAFQYVISQGDPQSTAKAKNTILYAIIGLVVCATAFSVITFVIIRI